MPASELDCSHPDVVISLAGRADGYIDDCLLPAVHRFAGPAVPAWEGAAAALEHPIACLRHVYGAYAFARRGRDNDALAAFAIGALDDLVASSSPEGFLSQPDARALWDRFEDECRSHKIKPLEQLNRGIVSGLAELAQEVFRLDGRGSIAAWLRDGIVRTSRLEPQFLRIVDIRGVGPKLASLLLRDTVQLFDAEEPLDHADRIFVQPIDRWMRLLAPHVIPDLASPSVADWVLAGKFAKYARRAGVSGIRFNMGASYFGHREVRSPEFLRQAIQDLSGRVPSLGHQAVVRDRQPI